MSSSLYRGQLERKRKQRIEAERKAGDLRSKESAQRAKAAKARSAADRATSTSTASSKRREAERAEAAAAAAGRDAAKKQDEANRYAKEEASLQKKLTDAGALTLGQPSGSVSKRNVGRAGAQLLTAEHLRRGCKRPKRP